MYEMDLEELTETIVQRKQGLAYKIWRLSTFTRHPFVKNFPETPEEACPELFPLKKGIAMPSFLKEKLAKRKRGGIS